MSGNPVTPFPYSAWTTRGPGFGYEAIDIPTENTSVVILVCKNKTESRGRGPEHARGYVHAVAGSRPMPRGRVTDRRREFHPWLVGRSRGFLTQPARQIRDVSVVRLRRRPVSAVLPRQRRLLRGRKCKDRLRVPEQSGTKPADGNRRQGIASRIGELRRAAATRSVIPGRRHGDHLDRRKQDDQCRLGA